LFQISKNGVFLKSDVHIDEANLILFNCLLYKHLKMILKNGPFVRSVVLKIKYFYSGLQGNCIQQLPFFCIAMR